MENHTKQVLEPLARRLAAAALSYRIGVTYQTAYKRIEKEPLGGYWYQMAEAINESAPTSIDEDWLTEDDFDENRQIDPKRLN
jgi:hypothetical protein